MHETRERLSTALSSVLVEKYSNKDYNQDAFLDEYITNNLPNCKIAGDVVLIDGWAFELDRTVPEIVSNLGQGNPEDFKQPDLTITKGTLANDNLSIPINITASESTNGISKIEIYKEGIPESIETFICSNEKTPVIKTFTAFENTKYKIVAYSKLKTNKTIEVTEIILPTPQIGNYVRYTPDESENYTKITTLTGGHSNQSISQDTELKWKILSLNDDGTIELISDRVISSTVSLQGALGYNNGVYLLNDLCKSHYSNASLGAVGRSLNLHDIEKNFNDDGKKARNSYTYNSTLFYGSKKTYSGNYPDIYQKHDKDTSQTENNIAQIESESYYSSPTDKVTVSENNLTVATTIYDISSQPNYYNKDSFHSLIFGAGNTTYWLASRATSTGSYYPGFSLHAISNNQITHYELFNWSIYTYSQNIAVRPVIEIPANYELKPIPGTNELKIVEK